MKIIFIFIVLNILIIKCLTAQRNYILNEFNAKNGLKSLEIKEWRIKLLKDIEDAIHKLPTNVKTALLERADKDNAGNWGSLRVSQFLEYVRIGNRNHYEGEYFERRHRLASLVFGELISGHGKYIEQIANGLWLILEESTWVLPAHLGIQKAGSGLPDPQDYVVDLFNAETGNDIAWIRLLLHDKLDKYAPHSMLIKRIDYEINKRISEPFVHKTFSWMGLGGQRVNNWDIWISDNVLQTALLAIDDEKTRNDVIIKSIHTADQFLNQNSEDGGCDEGPNYWNVAGGRLINFINSLSSVSNGKMSWKSNELIHKMGEYTYKMHIDTRYMVNFADASPRGLPEAPLVFLYGHEFNDTKLMQFASYIQEINDGKSYNSLKGTARNIPYKFIQELLAYSMINSLPPKAPQLAEAWMSHLQVLTLRSHEGSGKGLFFAAKGGNNAESHNHNDVGSFVLYLNGHPGLIDVGSGTYTAQTFSSKRYEIWNMQSQWHNCPSINGIMQHDGAHYKANQVSYTPVKDGGILEMDIAGAYPTDAAVKSWKRHFAFNGTHNTLLITETYELTQWKKPFQIHFITALNNIDHNQNGKVLLKDNNNNTLIIQYDEKLVDVQIEKKKIDDNHISSVWGDHVTRVNLISKEKPLKGQLTTQLTMM